MFLLWLRVAAVLYAAAALAAFPVVLYGVVRWRRSSVHLAGLALFFHFVSVVEMLAGAHRWLPMGAREVESLAGLAMVALYFLLWWIYSAEALGIFVLPAAFLVVLAPALTAGGASDARPGLGGGWLVAHIVALMAAYAAMGFSLLASVLYLVQERRIKSIKSRLKNPRRQEDGWGLPLDWLPPLDTLERIAHATLEFGFPAMTVGLVLGAVLAVESPLGAAYFCDPKVIASLVLWTIYVILLFLRRNAGLRGRKAAWLAGAVFLVMLAVLAANLLSQVHRYGWQ